MNSFVLMLLIMHHYVDWTESIVRCVKQTSWSVELALDWVGSWPNNRRGSRRKVQSRYIPPWQCQMGRQVRKLGKEEKRWFTNLQQFLFLCLFLVSTTFRVKILLKTFSSRISIPLWSFYSSKTLPQTKLPTTNSAYTTASFFVHFAVN